MSVLTKRAWCGRGISAQAFSLWLLAGLLTNSPNNVHHGLHDPGNQGIWRWQDNTIPDYTNWDPGRGAIIFYREVGSLFYDRRSTIFSGPPLMHKRLRRFLFSSDLDKIQKYNALLELPLPDPGLNVLCWMKFTVLLVSHCRGAYAWNCRLCLFPWVSWI